MCVDSQCVAPPFLEAPTLLSAVGLSTPGEIEITWNDPVVPAGFAIFDYFIHFNYGNGLQATATIAGPLAYRNVIISGLPSDTYFNVSITDAWEIVGRNNDGDTPTSNFIFNVRTN
jgi:hypothetical protein